MDGQSEAGSWDGEEWSQEAWVVAKMNVDQGM